jgi:hypothetical protein
MLLPAYLVSIVNNDVVITGVVEKEYERPPFKAVNGEILAVPETEKSVMYAVVAPLTPDTVMVHTTGSITLEG